MQRNSLLVLVVTLSVPALLHSQTEARKDYRSKDGRVVVLPIRRWTGDYISHESRLEFYSRDNELLCALDYSSEDHEHGFGVVKAAWTPDNDYFVFSLTSYSVRDHEIRSLDSYVAAGGIGIAKADFTLRPPNTVVTQVQGEESIPIRFRLDSLVNSGRKSKHSLSCAGGRVIHPNG